jgi:hypothetical protein
MGLTVWHVTSQFAYCVSHLPSALYWTILLILWVTQCTVILHAGFLVSYHNFLSFLLCFNKRSTPGISYFWSKIVVFLVDILYAEAIEAAKSCAALSARFEASQASGNTTAHSSEVSYQKSKVGITMHSFILVASAFFNLATRFKVCLVSGHLARNLLLGWKYPLAG